MTMWMLTEERKNELLRQKEIKLTELDNLKKKTISDLWRDDLDVFIEELDKLEKKELAEAIADLKEKQPAVSVISFCSCLSFFIGVFLQLCSLDLNTCFIQFVYNHE